MISVIMPCYNGESYIAEAIESVIGQTVTDWELIVTDDGSTDGSADIIRAYAEADRRITYIATPNLGAAHARNTGVTAARGEYIAFLDCDDIWLPDKLAKQLQLAESTKADIVYCSYRVFSDGCAAGKSHGEARTVHDLVQTPGTVSAEDIPGRDFIVPARTDYRHMLSVSVISCSTAFLTAQAAAAYPFDEGIYDEDYVCWISMMKGNLKAVGCTEILALYRVNASSKSFNKLKAAGRRWQLYRRTLKLPLITSVKCFIKYAVSGLIKYRHTAGKGITSSR